MKKISSILMLSAVLIACSSQEDKLKSALQNTNSKVLKREVAALCKDCYVRELVFSASDTHLTYLFQVMHGKTSEIIGPVKLLNEGTMLARIDSVFDCLEFNLQQLTLGKIDTLSALGLHEEIRKKLKNGTSFADCAREYSKDALGPQGGFVGRVSEINLPQSIIRVGRNFKSDETYLVHDLISGWVVFKNIDTPIERKHVKATTITTPKNK